MKNTSLIGIDLMSANFEIKSVEKLGTASRNLIATCSCDFSDSHVISGPVLPAFEVWNITLTSEESLEASKAVLIDEEERQQGFFRIPAHTQSKILLKCSYELLEELFNLGIEDSKNRSLTLIFSVESVEQTDQNGDALGTCNFVEIISETSVSCEPDDEPDNEDDRDNETISLLQDQVSDLSEQIGELTNLSYRINELERYALDTDSKFASANKAMSVRIRITQIIVFGALIISVLANIS
ncbi:hypothetical protein A3758_27265 [Oleiphilus sp. HI0118]|nr:hypothetical protein A3758_04210 [Oleiphilus sp. HI0118]KZZ53475.1 hypothetical protein A3758_27265 [Oleiphilus sp. HI0118]KZZ80893.1 hypothetical protein A3767_09175 [Oleiphilus sp. HI0133]